MARVPTELLCSILLASDDQMNEGLKSLNDLRKSVGNPGGGLM